MSVPLRFVLCCTIATLCTPIASNAGGSSQTHARVVIECNEDRLAGPVTKPLNPQLYSRELNRLIEDVSEAITEVNKSLEEWGTLSISGAVLAPPRYMGEDKKIYGTFAVDASKTEFDFKKWFEEAGKGEGTVRFTERIFNSLVAGGTLQVAPEQTEIANLFRQRQSIEQELYLDRVDRNRMLQQAQLEDFRRSREQSAAAREIRISSAQNRVDRAKVARDEAAIVRDSRSRTKDAADRELRRAEAALDALKLNNPNDPKIPAAQNAVNIATENAEDAEAELKAAEATLATRTSEETAANEALAAALGGGIATPGLPGSDLQIPGDFPTLNQETFTFAKEIEPGTTIAGAKTLVGGLPTVAPDANVAKLGDEALPELLRSDTEQAVFPTRARLVDAASNKTVMEIFNFLGNPSAALQFEDKPIIMAAGTFSANPGWRTKMDYDGQLDIEVKYEWKPARKETCERMLAYPELFHKDDLNVAKEYVNTGVWSPTAALLSRERAEKNTCVIRENPGNPLAAAVSPLMERQNLDEASSRARQDEIALFLSASLARSGQKAAGDVFNKYVKLRRLDVATRSSLPVVNSYNSGGGLFGFNVTSRLHALQDPSGRAPKPARILEKQSFPILMMFGLSTADLRPRVVITEKGIPQVWEPKIMLIQTHRWSRQAKRGAFHSVLRSIAFPGFPGRPMDEPSETYRLVMNVSNKRERLQRYLATMTQDDVKGSLAVENFLNISKQDFTVLNQLTFGTHTNLDLPVEYLVGVPKKAPAPASDPAIFDVFPQELRFRPVTLGGKPALKTRLIVFGANLDQVQRDGIRIVGGATPEIIEILKPSTITPEKQVVAMEVFFRDQPNAFQIVLPIADKEGSTGKVLFSPIINASKRAASLAEFVTGPSIITIPKGDFQEITKKEDPKLAEAKWKQCTFPVLFNTRNMTAEQIGNARVIVRPEQKIKTIENGEEKEEVIESRVQRPMVGQNGDLQVTVVLRVAPDFQGGNLRLELPADPAYALPEIPEFMPVRSEPITIRIGQ